MKRIGLLTDPHYMTYRFTKDLFFGYIKPNMFKEKTIIAICGYKGSGKDTLGQCLIDKTRTNYSIYSLDKSNNQNRLDVGSSERFAFADKLKREVFEEIPEIQQYDKDDQREFFMEHSKKKLTIDNLYYCHDLKTLYDSDSNKNIIITDLRFPREIAYIKSNKWPVIYIRVIKIGSEPPEDDGYERELDNFETDYVALRFKE